MDRHIIQSQQQHVNFVSNIRKKELKSFSMESLKRKRIKTTSCFSNGAFDVKRGLVISDKGLFSCLFSFFSSKILQKKQQDSNSYVGIQGKLTDH